MTLSEEAQKGGIKGARKGGIVRGEFLDRVGKSYWGRGKNKSERKTGKRKLKSQHRNAPDEGDKKV